LLVPLRDELREIGERMVRFFEVGGDPPFIVYPYPPSAEWQVRRDLIELQRWLAAPPRAIGCTSISLAQLFWQALEDSGFVEELISQDRAADRKPDTLAVVVEAVGEVLRQPPTLPDRVLAEVTAAEERSVVVLYRAGALYPAYRTSTLLDDLRGKLVRPVLLAYPGRLVGDYGLEFMDRSEAAYGYRALIVPREVPA
jgi:hypothetical protein